MRIAGRREEDFEINVISLIDVMLTLLMFFVMTTTFVQHSSMKVTLPEASSSEQSRDDQALVLLVERARVARSMIQTLARRVPANLVEALAISGGFAENALDDETSALEVAQRAAAPARCRT